MLHAIHSLQFRVHTPVLLILLVASLSIPAILTQPSSTALPVPGTANSAHQITAVEPAGTARERKLLADHSVKFDPGNQDWLLVWNPAGHGDC